ncbi:MAG TPA: hypothetical protein VKT75_06780 [Acidobacteriaceae bacterium]|nr:hypothetical protein [Acidobacteriaceae bacterium]
MPNRVPHSVCLLRLSSRAVNRRLKAAGIFAAAILLMLSIRTAAAQGCILARSPEGGLPAGQGGILSPGHFQLTIGERHQFSYQHYVGDVYQGYRAQAHTQVENRINLITANLTYQWTPRISVEVDAPFLFASRKTQNSPIKYEASGVGDTILGINSWIRNPLHYPKANLSLGLGVMAPTGNDDVTNTVNTNTTGAGAATIVTAPVDYSIQPGNGGWGMVMQWSGYSQAGKSMIAYWDGDYIATQGGTNGIQRGATLNTKQPLNNDVAISDQYLMEAGVILPVWHEHGIGATFGPRWEGVPARNLFPVSNDGFRRPGYAVTLGPGIEYAHGTNLLQAGVYKAVHRDRTTSYPDSVYGSHGDAAFAQYVWLASWTHRF